MGSFRAAGVRFVRGQAPGHVGWPWPCLRGREDDPAASTQIAQGAIGFVAHVPRMVVGLW